MSRLLIKNNALLKRVSSATIDIAAGTSQQQQHFTQIQSKSSSIIRRWKTFVHNAQRRNATPNSRTATFKTYGNGNRALSVLSSASLTTTPRLSQSSNNRTISSEKMPTKFLNLNNINPNIITMEYAVRGPLVIRAGEIEKELEKGVKKPFDRVIRANIGDCHAMGQRPITFLRQLISCVYNPSLMELQDCPSDVKERARGILGACQGHSVGSYTDSAGIEHIRKQVADHIQKRDGGIPCNWENIYLTAGATPGIKSVLSLLNARVQCKEPGIMVPIPQYPLYSATLAEYGMVKVDYYLEEETGWCLKRDELQRAFDEASKYCLPRAIVVINPGNPTGQVLAKDNVVEIIKFAYDNKLVILADEVYQDNIYEKDSKFHSFKKVMTEMGAPYNEIELCSFMSTSKGYLGECGIRGGYMELLNMDPSVKAMLTKSLTASLCATTAGQVAVSALVNPPKPGEPSHDLYMQEKNGVLESLKERADLVYQTLSSFEGYKVNPVEGAMYVFPQIEIPPKAIEAAKAKGIPADTFYAFELLEATGICIVSGSGFGQKPGTYHFRSTILPQKEELIIMMEKFKKFHAEFMKKYK